MEGSNFLSLNHLHVHKLRATFNQTYSFLHFIALTSIFYYRLAFFFNKTDPKYHMVPFFPWLITFTSELVLSFIWLLEQPFYWRPVTRTAYPERLPNKDEELPGIDVFICTADPETEPTFEVMNTVISAMALDYPAEKLSVYLSDDGGASATLNGIKEAWVFATWWLPFCRRYNVKSICPMAYFEKLNNEEKSQSKDFIEDRKIVEEKYEVFKERVRNMKGTSELNGDVNTLTSARNHQSVVQVINGNSTSDDAGEISNHHVTMPLLVYVAREKRPSHPHRFKAGALNVLLRVSGILSNSPFILVLDCDMHCNDSSSARQTMCFHLDPKISSSLGWVQYPQKYRNINEIDIYDSQMRTLWSVTWPGADGLQGPIISGTNFYIKRKALYGISIDDDNDIRDRRDSFGLSNEFLKSLNQNHKTDVIKGREISSVFQQEAQVLASCTYEEGTKWGQEVGFWYDTVMEDVKTGFMLQSKGWRSVYMNPPRPQFLGSTTTNLNEALIQSVRWYSGLIDLALSKCCPLVYTPSRANILLKMTLSWVIFFPLDVLPVSCLATILPLCFLHGIPLYPKVSDPFFLPFSIVFILSHLKHLYEFHVVSGGSIRSWLYEQRSSMIKAVTCGVYGTLDCVMTRLGLREASFIPTNKVEDDDKTKWYELGKYDFRTSNMFLVPLVTSVILNLTGFVGGIVRLIVTKNWELMFAQMCLSFYVLIMSVPVIEGMFLRKDNAHVPLVTTLISSVFSVGFLCLGYVILLH